MTHESLEPRIKFIERQNQEWDKKQKLLDDNIAKVAELTEAN